MQWPTRLCIGACGNVGKDRFRLQTKVGEQEGGGCVLLSGAPFLSCTSSSALPSSPSSSSENRARYIVYNLRNPSRINYQEDNGEDEEELMMGAEVRLLSPNNFFCVTRYFAYAKGKPYGSYPVDQSRQRPRPRKKRRYSMR